MSLFSEMTSASHDAIRRAKSQAEAMGHDLMGTRHVLLGLVTEEAGVSAGVLRSFGFELEETRERVRTVRSAPEEPNPGAAGRPRITRPALMALSYAVQEAQILGNDLADTEHVLLGLIRVAETHHDCGFARLVGYYDRLRIRNEILRLVAVPPDPADVARRRASAHAAPGAFATYIVSLLCDALKRMPADRASAIERMAVRFVFEQGEAAPPVIEVEWIPPSGAGAPHLDAYAVRIPPTGSGAERGMELRRQWLAGVVQRPDGVSDVASDASGGEIRAALSALGSSLHRLLQDSDVFWDVVGHSISTSVAPPPPGTGP